MNGFSGGIGLYNIGEVGGGCGGELNVEYWKRNLNLALIFFSSDSDEDNKIIMNPEKTP